MNNTITSIINNAITKERADQIADVQNCLDLLFPFISSGYQQSRQCVQHALSELHRVPDAAQICMLSLVMKRLRLLSGRFATIPSNSLNYIQNTPQLDARQIMEKVAPLLSGAQHANSLKMQIADALTYDERRCFANFVSDSIFHFGLQLEWRKDIIENHLFYFNILYPICVKDSVMDLFFNNYYNFLDRLSTSGHNQEARDCAENLLMIGHDRGMLAEAYYGASRAYTIANNAIGGLFYMNFALYCLEQTNVQIPQRFAFELLWQYLKILRVSSFTNRSSIDEVLAMFNKLGCRGYDLLSINHTAFSIKLTFGDKDFKSKVVDFLNENRETFFANLEHSAMPWLSLIRTYRNLNPETGNDELSMYEAAALSAVEKDGNGKYMDIMGDGDNLGKHLKEELLKLEATRSIDDFAHDNRTALVLAKKLLTKSVAEDKPQNYIMAMRAKSDFTFVMNEKTIKGEFARLEIEDVDGRECSSPYEDMRNLPPLTSADENDIIIWIGKGTDSYYCMKLIRGAYSFDKLEQLNKVNASFLQQEVISRQYYQKSYQPDKGPIYIKSVEDLEEESSKIKNAMKEATFEMPNVASRCLIAKDIEIASIPHQLMIDARTDSFIGEMMPTCNIISTELLIKSNFEDQLPEDYTKSFWLPIESGEFTFEEIKGRLGDVLDEHGFSVTESVVPDKPVTADLNIVCAHGGSDIGETQWFYANDKPIVETQKIVGKGRVLVLFVCHSGSMLHTSVDNAMHTIVKRYLRMGYSAVVAPMWSLATDILPCWLSKFMASINTHEYVIDAVYKANMAVKSEYTSVSAWGCMHLFGNPYVQINDKPRLQLIEKEYGEE